MWKKLGACIGVFWAGFPLLISAQTHVQYPAVWGRFTNAVDQSALNHPITDSSRVSVIGPHFAAVGPDGKSGTPDDTRVRFFGINLAHEPAFPSDAQGKNTAATLRSLGFNSVRLHHLDTLPTSDPDIFRSTLTTGPYPSFHDGALNRLKEFIGVLKREGLYVNLNLMVGYQFRPKEDRVPALDDKQEPLEFGSPVYVFHPRLVDLQVQHAQELIQRLGIGLDPVLAQVEIINESSLSAAWIRWDPKHWEKHIRGPYEIELKRQWRDWLLVKYKSQDNVCKAWGGCENSNISLLSPTEALVLQQIGGNKLMSRVRNKADEIIHLTAQTIGLSGSLISKDIEIHPRVKDFMQFLVATDQKFLDKMKSVIRLATRSDMAVTGTQMSYGAGLTMLSHANMDYIDEHFYGDETEFPAEAWAPWNWRVRNEGVSGPYFPKLLNLSLYRDFKRPFVVSEYGQPFPNKLGAEITPILSAVALQQDWDGLYLFDYVDGIADQSYINSFNLQGDWARTSLVGLSARMFRTGTMPSLSSSFSYPFSSSLVFQSIALRRRPDSLMLYAQRELQFDSYTALNHKVGYGVPPVSKDDSMRTTSSIQHYPSEKLLTFSTPFVAGVFGSITAGSPITAGSLSIDSTKSDARDFVTLMAHSLDKLPLADSNRILLAIPGYITGTQPGSMPPRPQKLVPYKGSPGWWTLEASPPQASQPSSARRGMPPLWLERKTIKVRLNGSQSALTVYPLSPLGERMTALPSTSVVKTTSGFTITLNAAPNETALWFELIGNTGVH